ncbi:MAG TPA: serine hydrolase [Candidatus Paceibacterota bacterium]|nr:serine hydrolase [Candidatus Paceibacterota bacterium]
MTTQEPDLKTLVRRLEKRHQKKQATTALVAATAVLGLTVLTAPLFMPKETAAPVAEAPSAIVALAPEAFTGVALEGKAAIVYDLTTGETLYEKNSRSQLPLASLTKLLTVYAASQALSAGSTVTITDSALRSEGESGFVAGERFAFGDLARLALVSSSNDATAAIAETAAVARATTGKNLLAGAASALGLSQTYALNGTGLDESTSVSGAYGSAKDIAVLSGEILKKAPDIARATVESSFSITSLDGVRHSLPNTNQEIVRVPNALLSKTGFTDLAGGNLAVVYDAGMGHPVAVVVLGSSRDGRFTDVRALIARADRYFAGIER